MNHSRHSKIIFNQTNTTPETPKSSEKRQHDEAQLVNKINRRKTVMGKEKYTVMPRTRRRIKLYVSAFESPRMAIL